MSLVALMLLAAAMFVIQTLIGGAKLVYGLPSYAFLGVAGLAVLLPRWRRRGSEPLKRIAPRQICLWAALAFALWVCARAWFSPVPYLARTDFLMMLGALLVYFITAVYLTDPRHRIAFLWMLFAYAAIHTLVGLVQFSEGNNFMLLPWLLRPDYGVRASGFYICPNHLAGLLEMLGLMALALCFWGRGRIWLRLVTGFAVAACLLGTSITLSRGGYLSTIAGVITFAGLSLVIVRKIKRREFTSYLAAAVMGLFVLIGGAFMLMNSSGSISRRMGQVYDPQNMRVFLWGAGLKQFALAPIVGTGAGTYLYHGRTFRSEHVQNDPIHVHNDYLELLAEYGLLGFGAFTVFLGVHLYSGYRGVRRIFWMKLKPSRRWTSQELAISLGALSALSAIAVHSLIDFNLHIPANTLFVAFLFGILANPTTAAGKTEERPAPARWLLFTPPGLAALLLLATVPRIHGEYLGERARMALRDKRFDEAAAYAQRALAQEKKSPDFYFYLGESQHHLGMLATDPAAKARHLEAAVAAFRLGLDVFPQDLRILLKIGRTLDVLQRYTEAKPFYDRALKADPNFGNVYATFAVHWHLRGELKLAEAFYTRARELGEEEISPVGLDEIQQDQKRVAFEPHPLSEFVTSEEEREAAPDAPTTPAPPPAPEPVPAPATTPAPLPVAAPFPATTPAPLPPSADRPPPIPDVPATPTPRGRSQMRIPRGISDPLAPLPATPIPRPEPFLPNPDSD